MFEKVRNFFNHCDKFAKFNNMVMTEVGDKYAVAELKITDNSLNGMDNVQGGAIMTLADFAFAGAANSTGKPTVAMGFNANFIRPGTGKKLVATAKLLHSGRQTAVGEVEVVNDMGKLIAKVTVTGFTVTPPAGFMEKIQ